MFSLSIIIGYLGVALVAYRQIQNSAGPLLLALMAVSVALVSIEISVVLIPLISLFAVAINNKVSWKSMIIKTTSAFVLVFGLLLVASHRLLISQYDVLVRLSGSGVAGWKSNFASFAMVFGMVPNQYSGPYSDGTKLFDVVIFIALAILCFSRVRENRKNSIVAYSLFGLVGIIVIAVQKWGIDGYQTWKLITSFTPIFMLLLVSLFLMGKNTEKSMSVVAISMLTVGATFSWSGFVWKDAQASSFINPDVAEVALSASSDRQDGINILLSPFFETMAVSAITGVPSHLSSMTYQFSTGQELRYSCTLTTIDRVVEIRNSGPIVHRRGDYVLIGSPKCR
jgi:hypothetical protein